jgi:hypothetical protein
LSHPALAAAVIFLGVFTQSLTGFGVALVSMAILPALIGIETASPLVALVALFLEGVLLLRYRRAFNLRVIGPLVLAAYFGIPLGVLALSQVDRNLVLKILGLLIAGYAVYGLFNFRLPAFSHPVWKYLAGFLAGLFGGAYNTSGPPVVIYGSSQDWTPSEFKTNLQGFFLFTDLFIVANHAWRGNLSGTVGEYFLWGIPAILLGVWAGVSLDHYIKPDVFRKLVLALLVILGLRLILA